MLASTAFLHPLHIACRQKLIPLTSSRFWGLAIDMQSSPAQSWTPPAHMLGFVALADADSLQSTGRNKSLAETDVPERERKDLSAVEKRAT